MALTSMPTKDLTRGSSICPRRPTSHTVSRLSVVRQSERKIQPVKIFHNQTSIDKDFIC